MTVGSDAVSIRLDDVASFSVKIQGAGVEPFELQVLTLAVCSYFPCLVFLFACF